MRPLETSCRVGCPAAADAKGVFCERAAGGGLANREKIVVDIERAVSNMANDRYKSSASRWLDGMVALTNQNSFVSLNT